MSNYTRLPIHTLGGALAYADLYANHGELEFEPSDAGFAFATLAAELRRLRPDLLTQDPEND